MDRIKLSFAKSIHTPKLVITSGSNSLYGISSKMITEELGIPTVNAAIYVGFGVEYILHRAQLILKPGDTILLPLEYALYFPNSLPDREGMNSLIDYVFAHDPKYLLTHPWLIIKLPFNRLAAGIYTKFHPFPPTDLSPWITLSGDALGNRESAITDKERAELNKQGPIDVTKLSYNSYEFKVIREFAEWCKRHKIRLIATWPNTMWFDKYQQPIYQEYFRDIEIFYKNINVPIIGNYRDFMYDKSLFFNTIYHLNHRGVRLRTNQIIDLLRQFFLEISSDNTKQDSSDAALFRMRSKQFGQRIQLLGQLQSAKANEVIQLPIKITNTSNFDWSSKEINPVNFAYHWKDAKTEMVVFNGEHTVLPKVLAPQETLQLNAVIKLPERSGNYKLILTMVQENIAWFNDKGTYPLEVAINVRSQ